MRLCQAHGAPAGALLPEGSRYQHRTAAPSRSLLPNRLLLGLETHAPAPAPRGHTHPSPKPGLLHDPHRGPTKGRAPPSPPRPALPEGGGMEGGVADILGWGGNARHRPPPAGSSEGLALNQDGGRGGGERVLSVVHEWLLALRCVPPAACNCSNILSIPFL